MAFLDDVFLFKYCDGFEFKTSKFLFTLFDLGSFAVIGRYLF